MSNDGHLELPGRVIGLYENVTGKGLPKEQEPYDATYLTIKTFFI